MMPTLSWLLEDGSSPNGIPRKRSFRREGVDECPSARGQRKEKRKERKSVEVGKNMLAKVWELEIVQVGCQKFAKWQDSK